MATFGLSNLSSVATTRPITAISLPPPITVTELEYASDCNSGSLAWSAANSSWYDAQQPTNCVALYGQTSAVSYLTNISVPLTTLCDGHPRTPQNYTWPVATSYLSIVTSSSCDAAPSITQTYTDLPPRCVIASDICTEMWRKFVTNGGYKFAGTANPPPLCSTSSGFAPGCEKCKVSAYGVQLYYWPPSTLGGRLCGAHGSTVTASPTGSGPDTRVVNGFTMTSPSAYLAFQNLAASAANNSCGPDTTSYTVAVAPSDLSSLSFITCDGIRNAQVTDCTSYSAGTTRVNFADLNWPVPFSAYNGMIQCVEPGTQSLCETMSLPFKPYLALPSFLTGVFPEWKGCEVVPTGVWDPPIALETAKVVKGPELTSHAPQTTVTSTAVPSANAQPPFASSTATATAVAEVTSIKPESSQSPRTSGEASPAVPAASAERSPIAQSPSLPGTTSVGIGAVIMSLLGGGPSDSGAHSSEVQDPQPTTIAGPPGSGLSWTSVLVSPSPYNPSIVQGDPPSTTTILSQVPTRSTLLPSATVVAVPTVTVVVSVSSHVTWTVDTLFPVQASTDPTSSAATLPVPSSGTASNPVSSPASTGHDGSATTKPQTSTALSSLPSVVGGSVAGTAGVSPTASSPSSGSGQSAGSAVPASSAPGRSMRRLLECIATAIAVVVCCCLL
ncbi:hypothetical protein LTR95_011983 [Oleoguttula sp. CCFEE 5521]